MPINIVCERCGHTRTISRDELQSGQWRRPCPNCQPQPDDDREIIDDETREDEAA